MLRQRCQQQLMLKRALEENHYFEFGFHHSDIDIDIAPAYCERKVYGFQHMWHAL